MIELIARKGGIQIDGIGGIEINIFAVGNKYCWTVRRAAGRGGEGVFAAGNVEFIGCSLIDRVV